ncbi:MAG TPA: methionine synthase [Streptosporangiaceae bacterium]|nr:methionine synthase [Streptosporangiaceae bacterium]
MSRDGQPFVWPECSATGIGSMPGAHPGEAEAVIFGELPELPHLAELPARGPGADLIGRTAALLVDLPAETTARGWRLAERGGRDVSRAAGMLSADLDALEEAADGHAGPVKLQVCGPWTLAAALELTRSIEPALTDQGAVADLTASLCEGVAAHVAAVRRRLPEASILLQLDEPSLPAVLAGSLPTASGLYRLAAVDATVAADGLRAVLAAAQAPGIVHCCAPDVPFGCVVSAGASAVSFDLGLLRRGQEDGVGEAAEAGLSIWAGAVPPLPPGGPAPGGAARSPQDAAHRTAVAVIGLWRRIGLDPGSLAEQVVVTPACGLVGVSPARARGVLAQCRAAARLVPELVQEGVA